MGNNQLLANILNTIINQGPIKEEYNEFTQYINLLGKRIKNNTISIEEVNNLKSNCTFLNSPESIMGHILNKPFGYAGDFKIIDRIYTRNTSTMFPKWDSFALCNSAAQAVRNRKEYFKKIATEKLKHGDLLNIASGPARDLSEYYKESKNNFVNCTCIEMDAEAIKHAKRLNKDYLNNIEFINKNIFRFNTLNKYDLIWSAGLFDYFEDKAFILLLNRFGKWLKPGGEIIIGNFNEDHNPSRVFMELFGEWYLNHRTEDQLINLAIDAGFKKENIKVEREPENVNLFLHIKL